MKNIKLFITFIVLFLFLLNYASAQFGFFTAYEGFSKAKELAENNGIETPVLTNVSWSNFTIPMGTLKLEGEMKFTDSEIGKANLWIYNFVDANDNSKCTLIGVGKFMNIFSGMQISPDILPYLDYSTNNQIILTENNDSPVFITKLLQNSTYIEYINKKVYNNVEKYIISVSILAINNETEIMEQNQNYWLFLANDTTEKENIDLFCAIKLDEVETGNINCQQIVGSITTLSNININLLPNPVSENLNVIIPIEFENNLSNIELFDVNGNLLNTYNVNTRNYNIAHLLNGNYYLCFTINNCKYYRSFIVSK